MKIEIGKEYKTRNGLKVKIYDIQKSGVYPVFAGVLKGNDISPVKYTRDGRFLPIKTGDLDIIGEWQEALDFDWACLPAWCNDYIAMDEDGRWFSFSKKPTCAIGARGSWCCLVRCEALLIPENYTPKNFKGTWKDSLFKNPNLPCEK